MSRHEKGFSPDNYNRLNLRQDLQILKRLHIAVPTELNDIRFLNDESHDAKIGKAVETQYANVITGSEKGPKAYSVFDHENEFLLTAVDDDGRIVSQRLYDSKLRQFTWFADIFYIRLKDGTTGKEVVSAIEVNHNLVDGQWLRSESLAKVSFSEGMGSGYDRDRREWEPQYLYQQKKNGYWSLVEKNLNDPIPENPHWYQRERFWNFNKKDEYLTHGVRIVKGLGLVELRFSFVYNVQRNGFDFSVRRINDRLEPRKPNEDMQWLFNAIKPEEINVISLLAEEGEPEWPKNNASLMGQLDLGNRKKLPRIAYNGQFFVADKDENGYYAVVHDGKSQQRVSAEVDEDGNLLSIKVEPFASSLN